MSSAHDDFENYLNLSPTVFFKCSADDAWNVLYVSDNIVTLVGYTKEAFTSRHISCKDIIHPEDFPLFSQEVAHFSATTLNHFKHTPYRLITKDKRTIWVEKHTQIVRDEKGQIRYFFGYVNDITSLRTYHKDLEVYQHMLDANTIITQSDLEGNIIYANEMFLRNTGYTYEEVLGKPHSILRHPDMPKEIFRELWGEIQQKRTWKGLLKSRKKDGSSYYANVYICALLDKDGQIEKYMGIRHDVTQLVETTEALTQQAQTDKLTGIGNRFKLLRDIKQMHNPFLALFDIARFREINDFYGYPTGDALLIAFAQQLRALAPDDCHLYRINANEFVLLREVTNKEECVCTVQNLHRAFNRQLLRVQQYDILISLILSLSFEPKEKLLITADIAKNYAKTNHLSFCGYSHEIELSKEYEGNIFWASKIKKALDEDAITLFLQPIYDNKTHKITKYETLVRLIDADTVYIPAKFLAIAKKTHQYLSITKTVISKACALFANTTLDFSINLTMEDIADEDLKAYLWKIAKHYDVEKRLILEIVESESIKDFTAITKFLHTSRELGFRLAIDDFGTGYSNFEYLYKLKANYIKIDGSIIQNIYAQDSTLGVIKAIVTFAQACDAKTIAEFVSSKEMFDAVCELGIDYSQGYYIGKPAPKLF